MRTHPRLGVDRRGVLLIDDREIPVIVDNVSTGGCCIRPETAIDGPELRRMKRAAGLRIEALGDVVKDKMLPVVFKHVPHARRKTLLWLGVRNFGSRSIISRSPISCMETRERCQKFLASRRKHKTIIGGAYELIWWGVFEPLRALRLLVRPKAPEVAEPSERGLPEVSTLWLRRLAARGRKQPAPAAAPAPEPSVALPRSA